MCEETLPHPKLIFMHQIHCKGSENIESEMVQTRKHVLVTRGISSEFGYG
jgi:hypothetical protein